MSHRTRRTFAALGLVVFLFVNGCQTEVDRPDERLEEAKRVIEASQFRAEEALQTLRQQRLEAARQLSESQLETRLCRKELERTSQELERTKRQAEEAQRAYEHERQRSLSSGMTSLLDLERSLEEIRVLREVLSALPPEQRAAAEERLVTLRRERAAAQERADAIQARVNEEIRQVRARTAALEEARRKKPGEGSQPVRPTPDMIRPVGLDPMPPRQP